MYRTYLLMICFLVKLESYSFTVLNIVVSFKQKPKQKRYSVLRSLVLMCLATFLYIETKPLLLTYLFSAAASAVSL